MISVKDLMSKPVITIDLSKTVFDAAVLMSEKRLGCLVVMDGNIPAGIITERDFVRKVVSKKIPVDTKISEVMSKPLIAIDPDAPLRDLSRVMMENQIRRLAVVKGNKLVGILVASDLARKLSKKIIIEEALEVMARNPLSRANRKNRTSNHL